MATINILRTGSLVVGGGGGTPEPSGHADTRFTVGGEVESKNITGTLDKQWMIDNGYYNEGAMKWSKTITQVDIGNTVTSIGQFAFDTCTILTSVTIPSSVTSIGGNAFEGCSGLTSVTISEGVTSVGDNAFDGCSGITSMTFPNSVTNIGMGVFTYCTGLANVTIGNGVISVGDFAFYGCENLTTITVLGKTTAAAQTLLANANVPGGCTIVGELG